jgi:hypothetical protein
MTAPDDKFIPEMEDDGTMRSLSRLLRRLLRLDALSLDLRIEEQLERNRIALEKKRRQWAGKTDRHAVSPPTR